jgi:hypothetical protein
MRHTTGTQNQNSTAGYDPETDPVIAGLRSHRSSRTIKRIVGVMAIAGLLAAIGWYARNAYMAHRSEVEETAARARAAAEAAELPVITPLQRAEDWCIETLGETEFASVPHLDTVSGRFFVTYTARPGDSIASVVKRFGTQSSLEPALWSEIRELAKRQHAERYRGRGLWVGDEIWLVLPLQPVDASIE